MHYFAQNISAEEKIEKVLIVDLQWVDPNAKEVPYKFQYIPVQISYSRDMPMH